MPTMICSPSATRRAMFSPIRSAPSSAPPAALSASAMRAPDDNVTSPGLCTSPTTLTTTGPSGAGADGGGCAVETISTGRQFGRYHRRGLVAKEREHGDQHGHHADDTNAMAPARPGISAYRSQPSGASPVLASGSQRDSAASDAVVAIGAGLGIGVCTEPAVEPLGGQFGSHVPDGRCEG